MDILSVIIIVLLMIVLALPLAKYIAKVFAAEKTFFDWFSPIEKFFFKISGIDPNEPMNWKQSLKALLMINLIWFVWAIVALVTQTWHPFWNPDNIPSMEPSLAFNTAISFMTNTNLQHYSGETGASYFTQTLVFTFLQFVSAGTGIAALAALYRALASKSGSNLGNFYNDLVRSCTRILLPLSVVVAVLLMINGSPSVFHGAKEVISMQGDTVKVSTGPAASMVAIKQLGTNGGGYFGPNSAHPFENPNFVTNAVETISILLIPIAMVFAFGYYLKKKKVAWVIFSVMLIGYLALLAPTVSGEKGGNPAIASLGMNQLQGNMEGKELRFGAAASGLWSITTTVTSNGSANSMHDSFMPLSGMCMMLGMQLNSFFGGVGVGFINMFVFIIVAVFISGLMVGRTPEFLGKKIEAKEVKIAIIVALLHPLLILSGVAIGAHIWATTTNPGDTLKWLANPGYHGFSEMLYTVTSSSANNGSEFGGLNGNLPFWNIMDGIVMILGRFIPIIGPIAIAGAFAAKKEVPESSGTLRTDSLMFGVVLFSVIVVLGALLFFPALALGPISEELSIP